MLALTARSRGVEFQMRNPSIDLVPSIESSSFPAQEGEGVLVGIQ